MRAVRIHRYGGPEVLTLEDVPRPVPGPGELLVRAMAAAVNPVDWKTRKGQGSARRWDGDRFPLILGWDVSGVVESLGAGVERFAPGDEVFGLVRFPEPGSCYAEHVAVPADHVVAKPAALGHSHAAALPLVALTAWQALFDTARLGAGETVLVHAAAGGVGHVAVQLARWKGARVVGTASAPNHDLVRSLGADEVVDYTTTRFEDVAHGVDVVLDPVGGDVLERSLDVLRPGGRLVSLVADPDAERAAGRGVEASRILVHPDAAQLADVAALVEAGALLPVVGAELSLAEAAEAHRLGEQGHNRGKTVLLPAS